MIGWLIADLVLVVALVGMLVATYHVEEIKVWIRQRFAKLDQTCYGCRFFGRCAVENFHCKDFTADDGKLTTMNIVGFTQTWREKHPYCKLDKSDKLLKARAELSLKLTVKDFEIEIGGEL